MVGYMLHRTCVAATSAGPEHEVPSGVCSTCDEPTVGGVMVHGELVEVAGASFFCDGTCTVGN